MAGIYGIVRFHGGLEPEEHHPIAAAMGHFGLHHSQAYTEEGVALGHLCLPTLPESRFEVLPRRSADGTLVITADARIDNRETLRDLLTIQASDVDVSDSELILAAYRKWGLDCPKHLVGDFAFAIWDQTERWLFCARDHLGNRPLFYFQDGNKFVFTSAIKGLLAIKNIPRRLNEQRVADFLVPRMIPAGEITFYEGIYRLPPGHCLTVTSRRTDVRAYWGLADIKDESFPRDFDFAEGVRELLEEAVRCRLRSTRPVGVLLSGGLDSSSVACVAARQLALRSERLYAFCSVPVSGYKDPAPKGWDADEYAYVDAIKKDVPNIDVRYCQCEGQSPLTYLERTPWPYDGPYSAVNQFWISCLLEQARECGVGVLLTGYLGNRTFSWTGRPELARLREPMRLASLVISILIPRRPWQRYYWKNRGEPWARYSAIHPDFARLMDVRQRYADQYNSMPHPLGRIDRLRYHIDNDRDIWAAIGTGYGLEILNPAADKRLIEYCFAIPDSEYRSGGWDRLLIRRSMEGVLPPLVQWRRSHGQQYPDLLYRLRGHEQEILRWVRRLEKSELWNRYIDVPKVRNIANGQLDHRSFPVLWSALTLGVFLLSFENGSAAGA